MKNKIFISVVSMIYFFSSCKVENIGKDLSAGVNQNADSIGRNLMAGIKRELTDPAFQQNLKNFVDSLVAAAGNGANRSVNNIIDSVTNERLVLFTRRLVEEATGQQLKANLSAITGNLQGNSRLLIVFNPNNSTGYAAASQKSPAWNKFRLDSLNAPNVLEKKEIIPGQVNYEWVNAQP